MPCERQPELQNSVQSIRAGTQIANSNHITVNPGYSRRKWMLEFCDVMLEFYPKEIAKIGERVSRFEQVRTYWEKKRD